MMLILFLRFLSQTQSKLGPAFSCIYHLCICGTASFLTLEIWSLSPVMWVGLWSVWSFVLRFCILSNPRSRLSFRPNCILTKRPSCWILIKQHPIMRRQAYGDVIHFERLWHHTSLWSFKYCFRDNEFMREVWRLESSELPGMHPNINIYKSISIYLYLYKWLTGRSKRTNLQTDY